MSTEVQICNLALSHIAISQSISNLETENTEEANTCRAFYDTVRSEMLREFPWPFASKTVALPLIETDPNDEWGYSYRYPTDCAGACRILSGRRMDTAASRVPFKISNDGDGKIIFTDMADAQLEYTADITDPALFSADFVMALSLKLAMFIAPRLTQGDPFKLREGVARLYAYEMSKAQALAGNEEQHDPEPECELLESR